MLLNRDELYEKLETDCMKKIKTLEKIRLPDKTIKK